MTELRVVRWDNVVHIVGGNRPYQPQLYADGSPAPPVHLVTTRCGRNAKMHPFSRNKFTDQAATCIVCVAGGYPNEQK